MIQRPGVHLRNSTYYCSGKEEKGNLIKDSVGRSRVWWQPSRQSNVPTTEENEQLVMVESSQEKNVYTPPYSSFLCVNPLTTYKGLTRHQYGPPSASEQKVKECRSRRRTLHPNFIREGGEWVSPDARDVRRPDDVYGKRRGSGGAILLVDGHGLFAGPWNSFVFSGKATVIVLQIWLWFPRWEMFYKFQYNKRQNFAQLRIITVT